MTDERELRILIWHVHGSWMTSFVQGRHRYLIPKLTEGGPWGRGTAGRLWPARATEVRAEQLAESDVDVVVLQRPDEIALTTRWLGRRPGQDVPAVYVEHNAPRPEAATSRHPLSDRSDIPVIHVTHFNELMWDCGDCPTQVIPHGIVDPGPRYTGELSHQATMINEPVRRWRVTGTDLLERFGTVAPVDVFGIGTETLARDLTPRTHQINGIGDFQQETVHHEVARRRLFLHTARWTSLGFSLLEAMAMGMPVVALATTEAPMAVPSGAGYVDTDVDALVAHARRLVAEPGEAMFVGKRAREHVLTHFGIPAFLDNWDAVLAKVAR